MTIAAGASEQVEVAVLDPDEESGARIAAALGISDVSVRVAGDWASLVRELRGSLPGLMLLHGELGSPPVHEVLRLLAQDARWASLPVALLARECGDARFVGQLRSGLVEMIPEPFSARPHAGRLRSLLTELPQRAGVYRGRGVGAELRAFLQHAQKALRSGGLALTTPDRMDGGLTMLRGAFKSADFAGKTGAFAVTAMVKVEQASWVFTPGEAPPEEQGTTLDGDHAEPLELLSPIEYRPDGTAVWVGRDAEVPSPPAAPPGFAGQRPEPPRGATAPVALKPRLLLADDDQDVRRLFATYFTKRGYAVTPAADGQEAFDQAAAVPFGLIVADLNMPRVDGWALLRMLREDYRTREVPVAVFSCQDDYRESLRAMHAGAQAFYPKTIRLDALEQQLREVLEPRERFRRCLVQQQSLLLDFAALGPQWVLRMLVAEQFSGKLDALDGWATYRLQFSSGALAGASVRSGQRHAEDEKALMAFVASHAAQGSLQFGAIDTFDAKPVTPIIERAVLALNEGQRRVADALMGAARFEVHPEPYELYSKVGPPHLREAARLLCEAKVLPAEVSTRLRLKPLQVEELVKDLVRRGVLSAVAPPQRG